MVKAIVTGNFVAIGPVSSLTDGFDRSFWGTRIGDLQSTQKGQPFSRRTFLYEEG